METRDRRLMPSRARRNERVSKPFHLASAQGVAQLAHGGAGDTVCTRDAQKQQALHRLQMPDSGVRQLLAIDAKDRKFRELRDLFQTLVRRVANFENTQSRAGGKATYPFRTRLAHYRLQILDLSK